MPHSPEVAEALEKSIEKWKRNAEIADLGDALVEADDCPLCHLFFLEKACSGCPVFERTRHMRCDETPYREACRGLNSNDIDRFRTASLREVAFLESLRDPEPHEPEKSGS